MRFTGRKESFPVFHQTNGLPIDFYIINSADPFRFLQRSVLIHVIPFSTDLLPASLHFAVFVQIILCVFYGAQLRRAEAGIQHRHGDADDQDDDEHEQVIDA